MRRPRGEAGSTLLESILSLLLVSTVILTLATGLLATTVSATRANESARLNVAMTAFTETLREMAYLAPTAGCDSASDAAEYFDRYTHLPGYQREGTDGLVVEILSVDYWKGNRGDASLPPVAAADQWNASCGVSGAQRLTVRLTEPAMLEGKRSSMTAQVVKRQESRQETQP